MLLVVSCTVMALLRGPLTARFHRLRVTHDGYTLPSPRQTMIASLGYRAALADLLYAHVLVDHGIHFQEKRLYEFVGAYLQTINELDPKFRAPYLFADTLLTLQPVTPPKEHYLMARRILERGMRERPMDTQLWYQAGQYIAYLAPAWLDSAEERQEWRRAGAHALARACELVGHDANIPYHCITAAGLLSRAGENDALLSWLERVIAVNDDEKVRELALAYMKQKVGKREQMRARRRLEQFRTQWQQDLAFVSKDKLLLLGPPFDPFRCAGLGRAFSLECASSWRTFWHRRDAQLQSRQ